ncbi:Pimeloyl-ACP methyl ester carboxylesterase [Saccharopolyspora kobensis]|uniref:Pimeloyl-ACP methyl ester carboxylesterase n=1 Tax=Saccharopolyspora kobensis TaxID=146035 RepID=A0A1H6AG19_9PSEU|nr:alpha/beta hydrolase [Saccharopolyspora kobensis]SEG47017.1 Pimeloyl-ACP methyl ester carboxylesterase [Saccharopolyspora kobensis]SFE55585.1 Pimeloyl-ACP methyl ester carboxylesterase [Saccharopolyspora kobensis]
MTDRRTAPAADHFVRYTETTAGRMRSRVFGCERAGAPPVIALMGMGVSDYLMPAMRALSTWTQAHLVDLPGLGGSGPARRWLDVPGYAAAVAEWVDRAQLPPAVLIGNSSSTQVAAHAAAMRPEHLQLLVLAGPTVDPAYRSTPRVLLHWRMDSRHPMPGLQQQHTPDWARAGFRQLWHLLQVHLRDRIEDTVHRVRCPVLVLRGDEDGLSTEAWARGLAAEAADGRFAVMPGPHSFVWSAPSAWSEPIREAVASVPGQGDARNHC